MLLQKRYFTLLELMAVIAIILLLTSVAGIYIGRERKGSLFEQSLRDFQVFCATARSESMRDGHIRKVVFYPEEKIFRIERDSAWNNFTTTVTIEDAESGEDLPYVVLEVVDPDADDFAEESEESFGREQAWRFPEKLEVNFELPEHAGVLIQEEKLELWRYLRNGSARQSHNLTVQMKDDARVFGVSEFTGFVELKKYDGREAYTGI